MRTEITEHQSQYQDLKAKCWEYGTIARSAFGVLFVRGWDQSGNHAWIIVRDTSLEADKVIESPPVIIRGYIVTLTAATVER